MSLSAEIADAIIALDKVVEEFEQMSAMRNGMSEHPTWHAVRESIEELQIVSLGEGQHFNSLEEARRFREPLPTRDALAAVVFIAVRCATTSRCTPAGTADRSATRGVQSFWAPFRLPDVRSLI